MTDDELRAAYVEVCRQRDLMAAQLKKYSKAARHVLDFFVEQAGERGEEGVPVVLCELLGLAAFYDEPETDEDQP